MTPESAATPGGAGTHGKRGKSKRSWRLLEGAFSRLGVGLRVTVTSPNSEKAEALLQSIHGFT